MTTPDKTWAHYQTQWLNYVKHGFTEAGKITSLSEFVKVFGKEIFYKSKKEHEAKYFLNPREREREREKVLSPTDVKM